MSYSDTRKEGSEPQGDKNKTKINSLFSAGPGTYTNLEYWPSATVKINAFHTTTRAKPA